MRPHWFLPETPDIVGHLRRETAAMIVGMDAFAAWADGEAGRPPGFARPAGRRTWRSERSWRPSARRS